MEVYSYHPEYKNFIGLAEADESPLEPGIYHIPAHATTVKPPTCSTGEVAVFNTINSSWEIIYDLRGTYYSIDEVYLGMTIENYNPHTSPEFTTNQTPPEIPNGKMLSWDDRWILLDKPITTDPLEKLQKLGLTVDDLRILLDL
jgi:hypothetical protein